MRDPPSAFSAAAKRSTRRWRLARIGTKLPGLTPDEPDSTPPTSGTDAGKTALIDFASVVTNLGRNTKAAVKAMPPWTTGCFTALVSAMSGGQWTQARRASVKEWCTTDICQLREAFKGTVGHRFACPTTPPTGGWPRPPTGADLATRALSADRLRYLKHNGMLALRIHTPKRSREGWFEWVLAPREDADLSDCTWYMDGSAMNAKWRSLATTGYGIVLTNLAGHLVAYGRGAPPEWIRTAAAAEAWALMMTLQRNFSAPRMATDCKSLVDTAARGSVVATSAKQALARVWNLIVASLDGHTQELEASGKLRWVLAHLGESAVGRILPCGRSFTVTDW